MTLSTFSHKLKQIAKRLRRRRPEATLYEPSRVGALANTDIRALAEQSEAWFAVCSVLHELAPGWNSKDKNGMTAAVEAIRSLKAGKETQ